MDGKRLGQAMLVVFGLPIGFFIIVCNKTQRIDPAHKLYSYGFYAQHLFSFPVLVEAIIGGLILGLVIGWLMIRDGGEAFVGAKFSRHLRGVRMVQPQVLARMTREKAKTQAAVGRGGKKVKTRVLQVLIGWIPMPLGVECLQTLIIGAIGTGKSVLLQLAVASILKRRNRLFVIDPDGDLYTRFGRPGIDIVLNPFDKRSPGWSIFDEIKKEYDLDAIGMSLIPLGVTKEAETWNSYGRLLACGVMTKLREHERGMNRPVLPPEIAGSLEGKNRIQQLFYWCTIAPVDECRKFIKGTNAESLFTGSSEANAALSSARFVLSDKLAKHQIMPEGKPGEGFCIKDWFAKNDGSNLYITWREDMALTLRALISTWTDIFFTAVLSTPEENCTQIWAILDELGSLEKLAMMEAALTKGRKHKLAAVACLQSTNQIKTTFGEDANTIRSCFRNFVALGGSKIDPDTCEDISRSLGEHDVERKTQSVSGGKSGNGKTASKQIEGKERLVSASMVASMPKLQCYVAFAENRPIALVKFKPGNHPPRPTVPRFVEDMPPDDPANTPEARLARAQAHLNTRRRHPHNRFNTWTP